MNGRLESEGGQVRREEQLTRLYARIQSGEFEENPTPAQLSLLSYGSYEQACATQLELCAAAADKFEAALAAAFGVADNPKKDALFLLAWVGAKSHVNGSELTGENLKMAAAYHYSLFVELIR